MKRFEAAWEDAQLDWYSYYLKNGHENDVPVEELKKRIKKCDPSIRLESMKEYMFTVLLMDSSYKEFFDMLMLRLHCQLQSEFSNKAPAHLIYNGLGIDDIRYWSLYANIRDIRKIREHDQTNRRKQKPPTQD